MLIQGPSLSPLEQPLRVSLEEPDAAVACREPWQRVLMKGQAFTIAEVEVPSA